MYVYRVLMELQDLQVFLEMQQKVVNLDLKDHQDKGEPL